jgi:hypothetical protein
MHISYEERDTMSELQNSRLTHADGAYDRRWNAQLYLKQYYSTETVPGDEEFNLRFLIEQLKSLQRTFPRAIEIGCGPTLHHTFPLAPYIHELWLADYLSENLSEIQSWRDATENAHNWDHYVRRTLCLEGKQATDCSVQSRKAEVRQKITSVVPCDVRSAEVIAGQSLFDFVSSYYCLESISSSICVWRECLGHVSSLVARGGALFLGVMRCCSFYHVFNDAFPATYLTEADLRSELVKLGYRSGDMIIETHQVADWQEQGFSGICCVRAIKE